MNDPLIIALAGLGCGVVVYGAWGVSLYRNARWYAARYDHMQAQLGAAWKDADVRAEELALEKALNKRRQERVARSTSAKKGHGTRVHAQVMRDPLLKEMTRG